MLLIYYSMSIWNSTMWKNESPASLFQIFVFVLLLVNLLLLLLLLNSSLHSHPVVRFENACGEAREKKNNPLKTFEFIFWIPLLDFKFKGIGFVLLFVKTDFELMWFVHRFCVHSISAQ